jgi:hypothetical protein
MAEEASIASDMHSLLSVHSLHPEPSDMTSCVPVIARPGTASDPSPLLISLPRLSPFRPNRADPSAPGHDAQAPARRGRRRRASLRAARLSAGRQTPLTRLICPIPRPDLQLITAPTSSIVSPAVVKAFAMAGGDFANAVPYALLMARASFVRCVPPPHPLPGIRSRAFATDPAHD